MITIGQAVKLASLKDSASLKTEVSKLSETVQVIGNILKHFRLI